MASKEEISIIPDETSFANRTSYLHEALKECCPRETLRRRSDTEVLALSQKRFFLENALRRHCEDEILRLRVYLREVNAALEQSTYRAADLTNRNYQMASAIAANDKALAMYREDKTEGGLPANKKCSKLKKEYYRREAALVADLQNQMDTVQNLRKLNIRLLHEIAFLRQNIKTLELNRDNDLHEEAPKEETYEAPEGETYEAPKEETYEATKETEGPQLVETELSPQA